MIQCAKNIQIPTSQRKWTELFEAAVEADREDMSRMVNSMLASESTREKLQNIENDDLGNLMNLLQLVRIQFLCIASGVHV